MESNKNTIPLISPIGSPIIKKIDVFSLFTIYWFVEVCNLGDIFFVSGALSSGCHPFLNILSERGRNKVNKVNPPQDSNRLSNRSQVSRVRHPNRSATDSFYVKLFSFNGWWEDFMKQEYYVQGQCGFGSNCFNEIDVDLGE